MKDMRFVFDDGVTKARYGLVLAVFAEEVMRVVGMWDDLAVAKAEANKRFAEFNPGVAMIQDTKTGELIRALNWHHDTLIWTKFEEHHD